MRVPGSGSPALTVDPDGAHDGMRTAGDRVRKRALEERDRTPDPDPYGRDHDEWNPGQGPNPGPAQSDLTVDKFFQPGGILSGRMESWEDRPGQWEMASGVAAAIGSRRHLIVEAGTGTGKTLAYLVPLVLAGIRAVISTGTKNLQEQLLRKDVPLLESLLGHKLHVALMKGRGNFLCLQKWEERVRKPMLEGTADLTDFGLIHDWASGTETGDRSELQTLRTDSRLWPQIDARRETCSGKQCEFFDRCYVTRMHQRAREADLIVVNHHLFFADLALSKDDFGAIIPHHQAVVFDEAHEIESVIGQFFGVSLGNSQLDELSRDVQGVASKAKFGSKQLDRLLKGLRTAGKNFFDLFSDMESRTTLREQSEFRRRHGKQYDSLASALEGLHSHISLVAGHSEEAEPFSNRAQSLLVTLRALMDDIDSDLADAAAGHPALSLMIDDRRENFVHWVEKRGKAVHLRATPIDVAPILAETLFQREGSALLTSATLAVDDTFDYVRGRLGMGNSNELIVAGHFDYRRQCLLYIPDNMPDPRANTYSERAAEEITRLLDLSRGRAFVLFTSYRQMTDIHKRVSSFLPYPCLMQGQGSNAALLDRFRATKNCVLFATMSFWQGVDVPGDQLSCVIVDKLPFAVPSDPVVGARIEQIRAEGGNPFQQYQIPSAVLTLKQGFGRLIRTASDRGVLALLDSRVVTKGYGRIFLKSLPDYPRTSSLDDVANFFQRPA